MQKRNDQTSIARIALVSMKHVDGDFAANLERHAYWLEKAAEYAPDFVGFPEFSLTGWVYDKGLSADAPQIRALAKLAAEYKVNIATGFVEKSGGKLFNTSIVVNPAGILGKMRKINLVGKEAAHYSAGHDFPIFDLGGFKLGIATCADSTRYEMFNLLSLRGAEIIFAPHANTLGAYGGHPDGWFRWRRERWPLFVKDSGVCVAGINNAGLFTREPAQNRNNYCGGGCIMDQTGNAISRLSGKQPRERLLCGEINLDELRAYRAKNNLMRELAAETIYRRQDLAAWKTLRDG